ncbi:MAG TPA: glycosyltransferase family 1 protein [Candidatus Eremiobacteraceae bacterium]|nr:glycosyltransferase family 1 protein [Candidatus Eremiobacteraceae bacterium]
MLRVALDTQFALGTPTGLGVYATRVAHALRARGDVDVVELRDDRFDLWRFDRRVYWDQLRARRLAREAHADVVHWTGGTLPWRPAHPCVLTLHDLAWRRAGNRGRAHIRWYFGRWQPRLARSADKLVTDTHAARADIADALRIDPERIAVAGAGVDERFFGLERKPQTPPVVLAVGTVEERKDLLTAVRAIACTTDARLISVGPLTPYADEVRREIERLNIGARVELRGFVADEELLGLYEQATALIAPSRYEGFDLPPLQALAAGVPVIASDIPVHREVLGDAAWYAPATDDSAFAALLDIAASGGPAVHNRVRLGRTIAGGFTWAAVAARLMNVYQEVCVG